MDSELWDRMPGETSKAYRAFTIYRDQGPAKRSLRSTALAFYGESTANLRQIEEWSRKYRWVLRAAAYDAEQDRLLREQRRRDIEEARERARRAANLAQRIALRPMVEIADSLETVHRPPVELMRYLMDATKLEWIALGIPFEIVRQEIDAPTPEDLESEEKIETARRARGAFRNSRGGSR